MHARVIHVVGAAIIEDGLVLVAQRAAGSTEPLQWEFPGGKVEPEETPEAALRREIDEELGLRIQVGDFLGRGSAERPVGEIRLDVYGARILEGRPVAREHAAIAWLDAAGLGRLDWAQADRPIVEVVRRLIATT